VSPWPQYYLAALGQWLFGSAYTMVRLIFLVFGVGSVILLYRAVYQLAMDKRLAVFSAVVTSLSVQYILFAYQIRYYPVLFFFAALFLIGVARTLRDKPHGFLLLVIGGIGAIYTHYIAFIFYYPALLIGSFLWLRLSKKSVIPFIGRYIGAGLIAGIVFVPWFLWLKPAAYQIAAFVPWQIISLSPVKSFLSAIDMANGTNMLPYGVWIAAVFFIIYRLRRHTSVALYGFLGGSILGYFVLTSIADGATYSVSTFVAFRYQVIVFPLYLWLTALILDDLWRIRWWVCVLGIVLFVVTNLGTAQTPHVIMADYVHELIAPPPSPDALVAQYLAAHAKDGDTAMANLDRSYEPLMYLLGTKVRFVNRISMTNPRLFPVNRAILPRYLYDYMREPDWVIIYSKYAPDGSFFLTEYNDIPPFVDLTRDYEEIVLPVFFSDVSRPELFWHAFYPIDPGDLDKIYLYKKKVL
jgi:hypothetical protein